MTKKRRKELNRIKAFIRKAEKRGYTFDDNFKQSINTKTTRALQMLTPRRLYESAMFSIGGELVSGLRGRAIERERAAAKGVLTRKAKKENKNIEPPKMNDLVYQNVMELINSYPSSIGAEYLRNLLKSEIRTYGLNKVISGMTAIGEDFVKRAAEIIHYEGDSFRIHDALVTFSDIIRAGVKMTEEESKEINNVVESL